MSEITPKQKNKPIKKKLHTPFSENLQQLINIRSLTQVAVAELAGISPSVVNNWLSGVVPQDLAAVHKLCMSLGISFEWLLLNIGTMELKTQQSLENLFDETDLFDGLIKITAKKLVPKKDTKL